MSSPRRGTLALLFVVFYHPAFDVCHPRTTPSWLGVLASSRRDLDGAVVLLGFGIARIAYALVVTLAARRAFRWSDVTRPNVEFIAAAPRTWAALAAIACALVYATQYRFDVSRRAGSANIHDRLTGARYVETYPAACNSSQEPRGYSP